MIIRATIDNLTTMIMGALAARSGRLEPKEVADKAIYIGVDG